MDLAQLTMLAFAGFSSLRVVSYIPQIAKAADRNGAPSPTKPGPCGRAANIATRMYAAVNLQDLHLSVVSGIYAVCCVVVIGLTALKRRAARSS
jgi:hypothetical protein